MGGIVPTFRFRREGRFYHRVTDIVSRAEDVLGQGLRFVMYRLRGLGHGDFRGGRKG